jgi:hypothetical protein
VASELLGLVVEGCVEGAGLGLGMLARVVGGLKGPSDGAVEDVV